jgi:hypothetical protein
MLMVRSTIPNQASGRYNGGARLNIFGIFAEALSQLHHGRIAVPLLLYFALRIAIVSLYLASVTEPLSSFWALLIGGLSGEDLGHYPVHLILMPAILGRLDIALDILVSVLFQGATIALVASAYRRGPVSLAAGFSEAARGYRHMIVVMLVVSIALFACINVPRFLATHLDDVARLGTTGLALLLGLCVQALFLYAIPLIVLEGYPAPRAIAASARFARRNAFTTFLLVAAPFILTVPTLLLGFRAEMIAFRISPDFLLINQIAGEIMQLIATYLIIGGATITLIRGLRSETDTIPIDKSTEAINESVDHTGKNRPVRTGA